MSFLVDTCVFSERLKRRPNEAVIDWIETNEPMLYVSTITIGEIRRGVERLRRGKRRTRFQHWLTRLSQTMHGRILSYNRAVAHVWGQMQAQMEAKGHRCPAFDGIIAATAIRHGLTVVTRNESDFRRTGVAVLNPFASS